MKKETKWQILNKIDVADTTDSKELLKILLENRGLTTKNEQDAFLYPNLKNVTVKSVGLNEKNLQNVVTLIKKAIKEKQEIVVFGDYDVDGIAGTAILWETLNSLGAKVMPYIPSRTEEGYGLSIAGIENILEKNPKTKLIITVDNGIVAHEAVDFAKSKGLDVIVTDHHVPSSELPKADGIAHTTLLCGTGVAWMLSKEIQKQRYSSSESEKFSLRSNNNMLDDHLALVALATVADLVPLTNGNRVLLTEGLKVLQATRRPGILALCSDAQIQQKDINVYAIGHVLAPRLNAMGRIASAMDSLRLLCTKDSMRAKALAEKLGTTNKERQNMTKSLSLHAIEKVRNGKAKLQDLLVVYDEAYDEGVIGLVAGKLVEEFYRPSIVLSIGERVSKASARSISGFNIIEFIRNAQHLLINAGGHPMAAGFTVYTEKINELETFFVEKLQGYITKDLFVRTLKIDYALPFSFLSQKFYDLLQQLQPFGMGNPEPTFVSTAKILSLKQVGIDKRHISFSFGDIKSSMKLFGIGFGMGELFGDYKVGEEVEVVYTLDENVWNNKKSLQLKVKDIKQKN